MHDIGLELRNLMNLIVRQSHKDVHNFNISMPHGGIIKYLMEHKDKDITAKDFESILMTRKSTLSRMFMLMENNGLITRVDDLNDSRKKYIKLTSKAIEFHNHMTEHFNILETKMVKNIKEEDLDVFISVIHQMKKNLQEEESN